MEGGFKEKRRGREILFGKAHGCRMFCTESRADLDFCSVLWYNLLIVGFKTEKDHAKNK